MGIIRQPVCIFRTEREADAELAAETLLDREFQVAMDAELLPDLQVELAADEVLTEGLCYTVFVAARDAESACEALSSIGFVGRIEPEGRSLKPWVRVYIKLALIFFFAALVIWPVWILVSEVFGNGL